MTFPVYQVKEWQCRHVFPDQKCCGLPSGHSGDHRVARAHYSIGHGLTYLECPCCGDDGAASDGEGCFFDGQPLICGCPGWVSVDADDSEDDPYINNGDAPCEKCRER